MDRSPQFAKNAANAAKKRSMNRSRKTQSGKNNYISTGRNGEYRVVQRTVKNREGREYKVFQGRNWSREPEQISGPPMPNTWLPENGYGSSPRPYYTMAPPEETRYYTMEPPEEKVGTYNSRTGETAYGGKRRSRKMRRTRR
uniref:Uncharacterized protein n=1 Tax=viral metagenome TaxID=1070528 RepID=A0A6C0KYV9_9ZZZZ